MIESVFLSHFNGKIAPSIHVRADQPTGMWGVSVVKPQWNVYGITSQVKESQQI